MYEQVLLVDACGFVSYPTDSEFQGPPSSARPRPKSPSGRTKRVYGTPDHSPKFGAQSLFTISRDPSVLQSLQIRYI